ncbi:MAG TPA: DUF2541 family protein [Chitinophagales bacterium]|nr:DUF2541 family protein [Chitinophagales bacterium]
MKRKFLIIMMSMAAFGAGAFAQTKPVVEVKDNPGWHKIAETVVNLKTDQDELMVLGADHYKAIRLKATDSDIEITDVRVMYENEQVQDIEVRKILKAGEQTREIDLDGKDRAIKKIRLTYKTVPNAKQDKAHLEIWGLK